MNTKIILFQDTLIKYAGYLRVFKKDVSDVKQSLSENKQDLESVRETFIKTHEEIDSKVQSHMNNMRQPKDGEDAVVDYDALKNHINAEVDKIVLPKPATVDYELVNRVIADEVAKLPKAKDGETPTVDYQKIFSEVLKNIPEENIAKKVMGRVKAEVVGIKKTDFKDGYLIIYYTNGKIEKHKVEFKKISMFGGSGGGGGGTDFSKLSEITTLIDTDFIVVIRDGKPVKISALNASNYFGGISNAVEYNGEAVTYNGEVVTFIE